MGELKEFASEVWEVARLRARGKSRKRLLDPDNRPVRLPARSIVGWTTSPRHPTRFFLGAQSRNHVRILLGAAAILASRGSPCTFIDLDLNREDSSVVKELALSGIRPIQFSHLLEELRRGDVIATCSKGVGLLPKWFVRLVGVRQVGVAEGVRYQAKGRHSFIDEFLAWGPATVSAFEVPVRTVGSPVLEAVRCLPKRIENAPLALINYKFAPSNQNAISRTPDEDDPGPAWLAAVLEACDKAGLHPVISAHPKARALPRAVSFSTEDFRTLLPGASVLVTPVSTTVFEAAVLGVPIVLLPSAGEFLGELSEPDGAFDILPDAANLAEALRRAIAEAEIRAPLVKRFLEKHVSFDPARTADERIADALVEISAQVP